MEKATHDLTFPTVFEAREDLKKFGSNALALFTLSLYLQIDDIDDFALNFLTDGGNDKKLDICYFDEESHHIVLAQNYFAKEWNKESAIDKAGSLNTALGWLFSVESKEVPIGLRAKAIEIRNAIENGGVNKIELLYIHNCKESKNCQTELKASTALLRDILKSNSKVDINKIYLSYKEFGLSEIETLYKSKDSQIIIDDWLAFPSIDKYVEEKTKGWTALLTSIPAIWIQDLFKKYGDDLFSANYRGYLGSNLREENINRQIVDTAETEPENFWAFNNGITALTYMFDFSTEEKRIRGISIINGAQTTGALGNANKLSVEKARVLIRLISCNSHKLIDDIILYNNTQNEIKPEDRRSKDSKQERIQQDFAKFGIEYSYRRNEKKVSRHTITGKSVAAVICAFHGNPQTSFRNPKKIFNDDDVYNTVFPSDIKVEHIFLLRALSIAIDEVKKEFNEKNEIGNLKATDEKQYKFLKYSATKHFLVYLIGELSEEIMNSRITNKYFWQCKDELIKIDNKSLVNAWKKVVLTVLPPTVFIIGNRSGDPFYDVPRSTVETKKVASEIKIYLNSFEETLNQQFADIRKRTVV